MADEALQEVRALEGHQPRFRGPVVYPRKGHLSIGKRIDAVVADGYPVRVPPYIFDHVVARWEWFPGINHPFGPVQRVQVLLFGNHVSLDGIDRKMVDHHPLPEFL